MLKKIISILAITAVIATIIPISALAAWPTKKSDVKNDSASVAVNTSYPINLSEIFEDADGDELTYYITKAKQVGDTERYRQIGDTEHIDTDVYLYTPQTAGEIRLQISANDGENYSMSSHYVFITATNTAPKRKDNINPTDNANITVNTPYRLNLNNIFEDINKDSLTYKVSIDGGAFNQTISESYSYIPTELKSYTFVFKASDGTLDSSDTYTVTLTANNPPSTNTIPNRKSDVLETKTENIKVGSIYTLDLSTIFEDVDTDGLVYEVAVNGGSYESTDMIYKYPANTSETKNLVFRAKDATDYSTDVYKVTLNMGNEPSFVDAIKAEPSKVVTGERGIAYTIDLSNIFEDKDGDPLTYKVSINNLSYESANESYSYTPTGFGEYMLRFKANDGAWDSSDIYKVTIDVHQPFPPVFKSNEWRAPRDIKGIIGGTVTLDAQADEVFDGGSVTYEWYRVDGTDKKNPTRVTSDEIAYQYKVPTESPGTSYYYCKLTNTIVGANKTESTSIETSVATVTITLPPLLATVLINNTSPQYGDSLSATVENSNSIKNHSYQWYRGSNAIPAATESTYNVVEADIGETLKVEVKSDDTSDSVESASTSQVQKATAYKPTAPTLASKTHDSITLTEISGNEYSKDNGVTWQDGVQFTGLSPETSYGFVQRVKETSTHKASEASDVENIETLPAPLSGIVTITGTPTFGEELTVNVSGVTNANGVLEYQWQRNGASIDGATESKYTLVEADIGTKITCIVSDSGSNPREGEVLSEATNTIAKATASKPTAPTLASKTHNSITLTETSGNEYSKDNGVTWQDRVLFTGLTPETTYSFIQRVKETSTHKASASSNPIGIKTEEAPLNTLLGTVTIKGTAEFGKELAADVIGVINANGVLEYQWQRNGSSIDGATESKYTLVGADISSKITCVVTDSGPNAREGEVVSSATSTVVKATTSKPNKPTLSSKTHNSITLKEVIGNEYSKDGGVTWQDRVLFTSLTPNTSYSFIQRVKATSTNYESVNSDKLDVKTNTKPKPKPRPRPNRKPSSITTVPVEKPAHTSEKKAEEAINNAKPNEDGVKEVTIEVKEEKDGSINFELPDNFLRSGTDVNLTLKTKKADISLPSKMFTGQEKSIELTLKPIDKKDLKLSAEARSLIGDLPVLNIELIIDGEKVAWQSDEDISIDIKLNSNDGKESYRYVAVYIDENGNMQLLKSSLYTNGEMHLTTKHLSHYGVIYVDKSFEDIKNHWAKEAVEGLAARGVIEGTSDTTYSPLKNIIRADFVTLIVRLFDFKGNTSNNFDDVKDNKYYSDSIAIAKDLGIVTGSNDNKFNPLVAITRQDMMVILERALKVSKESEKLRLTDKSYLDFNDSDSVEKHAIESVDYLIKTGLINGTNNYINPKDKTTRAEVAQMLYNLVLKLNNN